MKTDKYVELSTGSLYLQADSIPDAVKKLETLVDLGVTQVTVTFRVKDKKCC